MVVQKRGEKMVSKMGRPTNSRKDIRLQIRVDKETEEMLDFCADKKITNRSEIVREGIRLVYDDLQK